MNTNKKTSQFTDGSLSSAAIVAGLGLLIMAILAPIVQFGVLQKLILPGNAKATVENIMASATLFRTGIFIFLVVAILDVVVAWALYILLKPVNKRLSLLAAWFRVVYAAIFAVALTNLANVLQLLTGAEYLKAFEANQLYAQGMGIPKCISIWMGYRTGDFWFASAGCRLFGFQVWLYPKMAGRFIGHCRYRLHG